MLPVPEGLTRTSLEALIAANRVEIDSRLTLLDYDLNDVEDITEHLEPAGSSITWTARTGVHRACRLNLTRELDWGTALVRPSMVITAGEVTADLPCGVFVTSRVSRQVQGEDLPTFPVSGFDRLELLNTEVGRTVRVAAGTAYLEAVADLIAEVDPATDPAALVLIDSTGSDTMLPADRLWVLGQGHTYLAIINGLLLAAGYRALWVDATGRYRLTPYVAPTNRVAEWTYDTTDPTTTLVHPVRTEDADWWDVPNEWIFTRDRPSVGLTSGSDGTDGRLVVTNQSTGPTSIDARRGVVRRRIVRLDAADAGALAAQAADIVAEDQQVITRRTLTVEPNPMHGHLDILRVVDHQLGTGKALTTGWTLHLDGAPMPLQVEMV